VLGLENGKPLVLPVTDRVDMVALGLVVELVPVEVVVVANSERPLLVCSKFAVGLF
jgi:hypothetical protein